MAQDKEKKDNGQAGAIPPEENMAEIKQSKNQDEMMGAGTVTQAPAMQPKKSKSKLFMWLMVIIILLALILAGLFGWLWWRDRNQSANEGTSTEPTVSDGTPADDPVDEAVCTDGFTIYTNTDLGVQFCYPTAWGEPSVSDAKFADADTGSRWLVSFDGNDAVHAGLASPDWDTEVPRDGTCVDPAVTAMPTMSPFSTDWTTETTEGDTVTSATRGVEIDDTTLLIREYVSSLLVEGACLEGYKAIDSPAYDVASASYYAVFNDTVTNAQQHIDNPNVLISTEDRADFATFVESIVAFEE